MSNTLTKIAIGPPPVMFDGRHPTPRNTGQIRMPHPQLAPPQLQNTYTGFHPPKPPKPNNKVINRFKQNRSIYGGEQAFLDAKGGHQLRGTDYYQSDYPGLDNFNIVGSVGVAGASMYGALGKSRGAKTVGRVLDYTDNLGNVTRAGSYLPGALGRGMQHTTNFLNQDINDVSRATRTFARGAGTAAIDGATAFGSGAGVSGAKAAAGSGLRGAATTAKGMLPSLAKGGVKSVGRAAGPLSALFTLNRDIENGKIMADRLGVRNRVLRGLLTGASIGGRMAVSTAGMLAGGAATPYAGFVGGLVGSTGANAAYDRFFDSIAKKQFSANAQRSANKYMVDAYSGVQDTGDRAGWYGSLSPEQFNNVVKAAKGNPKLQEQILRNRPTTQYANK